MCLILLVFNNNLNVLSQFFGALLRLGRHIGGIEVFVLDLHPQHVVAHGIQLDLG